MKLKRKSLRSAEQQVIKNQMLVSEIKDTLSWLEPELTDEQILNKLVIMLTPMCETPILNALNSFLNSLTTKQPKTITNLYNRNGK